MYGGIYVHRIALVCDIDMGGEENPQRFGQRDTRGLGYDELQGL